MTDLYQETLLEHYQSPQNKGEFSGEKRDIKTVKNINVGCGDEVVVEVRLNEKKDSIEDIRWQGVGCVISMASMSILSEHVKGKRISEVLQFDKDTLLRLLELNEITPAREKCLLLSLKTIQRALKDHND